MSDECDLQARVDCQVFIADSEFVIRWSNAGLVVKERSIQRHQILSVEYVFLHSCGLCINVVALTSSSAYNALLPHTGSA